MEFVLSSSESFSTKFADFDELIGQCRFIHIDSSHFYETTFKELQMAEQLISDGGIVVLDDFTNLNYSQILAATYKYLYTQKTRLMVLLVTEEKAYLCKKEDFAAYGHFILNRSITLLSTFGVEDACMARTDATPEYRAFHLRRLLPGETERQYGTSLYGQFLREP